MTKYGNKKEYGAYRRLSGIIDKLIQIRKYVNRGILYFSTIMTNMVFKKIDHKNHK
jgi:hypothetical protein